MGNVPRSLATSFGGNLEKGKSSCFKQVKQVPNDASHVSYEENLHLDTKPWDSQLLKSGKPLKLVITICGTGRTARILIQRLNLILKCPAN